jgi:hypothetical protein
MAALSSALVSLNLLPLLAKTNFWPLQTQLSTHFEMQPAKARSCTAAKVTCVCVLPLLNE